MRKYRTRMFCSVSPEPRLWQTDGILAHDDASPGTFAQALKCILKTSAPSQRNSPKMLIFTTQNHGVSLTGPKL